MGIFNNLFDIDSKDNYAVTGINKELNSLYIYNYNRINILFKFFQFYFSISNTYIFYFNLNFRKQLF